MITYGYIKEVNMSYENAVAKVVDRLEREDFGILIKIDIKKKFKEKLGIDFKNYMIIGACHPLSAYKAIEAEENIGLMLPCNVIVYEYVDKIRISVIKPTVAMGMINNSDLKIIAGRIEKKLERVVDSLM